MMTPEGERLRATRSEVLGLLAITLVAAALRVYRLGDWLPYADELLGRARMERGVIEVPLSPVGYLPIAGITWLFGWEPWAMRLWPCLIGIATVPVLYLVGRKLGGRSMAMWAAALLAIAPWHIAESQFARHYPQQLLLGLLTVYFLFIATERNATRSYLLAALMAVLMIFTRMSSVCLMAPLIGYCGLLLVWPSLRPSVLSWRRVISLMAAFAALIFVGWLLNLTVYTSRGPYGRSPFHVVATMAYYFTPSAVLAAAVAALAGLHARNRMVILLGVYAFGTIAVVAVLAVGRVSLGVVTFMGLPGVILLAAWAIARLADRLVGPERWLAPILGFALLGSSAVLDYEYFTIAHGWRPRFEDAAAYIARRAAPSEHVFINRNPANMQGAMDRYDSSLRLRWLTAVPAALPTDRRTWFVVEDLYSMWDLPDPNRQWLDDHAQLMTVLPAYIGPRSRSLWIYAYPPTRQAGATAGATAQP